MTSSRPGNPAPEAARLAGMKPALELRSRILQALRTFFINRGYLEVETPVRLSSPALETHIDAEPSGELFLRTSPELHMKRLVAAGYSRIFQIGPCFRRGERGSRHHPEYTMLEWYRTGADYKDILKETKELLASIACDTAYDGSLVTAPEWLIMTVSDAFSQWAGWDPCTEHDPERFDLDLVEKIEPALPRDRPVILIDYPAWAGALARRRLDAHHLAERWELYLGGLEIANAYTELTDPREQQERFDRAARERSRLGRPDYPPDKAFMEALCRGLPPCGGIAMGIDRLVMAMTGAASIHDVMTFQEPADS